MLMELNNTIDVQLGVVAEKRELAEMSLANEDLLSYSDALNKLFELITRRELLKVVLKEEPVVAVSQTI